jgi:hypothetical protein
LCWKGRSQEKKCSEESSKGGFRGTTHKELLSKTNKQLPRSHNLTVLLFLLAPPFLTEKIQILRKS